MVLVVSLCPLESPEEHQGGLASSECFHLGPALDGCKLTFSAGVMLPYYRVACLCFIFGGGQQ